MAAFGDLDLPFQDDPRVLMRFINFLAKLGYETIAVNRTITPQANPKRSAEKIPLPPDLSKLPGLEDTKKVHPRLKLLSRITLVVDDPSQLRHVSSETVQSYDILGIRPETEKLFQQIAEGIEADILSFDMTSRLPFFIKRPQVNAAIQRGMSFEVLYSPAIRDESLRRNIISNALDLIRVCKGRNVILSSGAENVMELRGPYDVVNLGLLFGLKQDQSKASVCKNIRSVIYYAEARNRAVKGLISLERLRVQPSAAGVKRELGDVDVKEDNRKKMKVET